MEKLLSVVLGLALTGNLLCARQNAAAAVPQNDPGAKKCLLTGRVTDATSGEPLRKVSVRLSRRGGSSTGFASQGYAGTSDSDGSFRFEGVEPGQYNLSGERSGYLVTQYGAKSPMQMGTTLELHAGQEMTGVALALIPQGSISGRIVDEDGDPLGGVQVQAIRRNWMRGGMRNMPAGSASTDDSGEFRIARLQQGRYYVMAAKQSMQPGNYLPAIPSEKDIRPVSTYYPDATAIDTAAALELRSGQNVSGLDIRLRTSETFHVRGKISGNAAAGPGDRLIVSINSQDDVFGNPFGHPANVGRDRVFDFAGIAPGKYIVTATEMAGNARSLAHQEVQVGGGDVSDVVLDLVAPGSLRGQVRVDGAPSGDKASGDLAQVRVMLTPSDSPSFGMGGGTAMARADGSFVLENVSAGRYFLNIGSNPRGTYLVSARLGQQELAGREIDLSQGAAGELQVILRYGAAEVSGTVQADSSASGGEVSNAAAPAKPTMFVLIPETLNADGSGTRMASPDQSGSFTLSQLTPGRYHAVAIEMVDYNDLQNPEFLKQLAAHGMEVELKENDKRKLQLSPVSASDLRQVMVQAGLDAQ